jgi:hypothetical protein
MNYSTEYELRRRALLPPVLEDVQRQFWALAGAAAKAEMVLANLTSSHRSAVMQLFSPTRFHMVPEQEIYRMHATAAGRIQLGLSRPFFGRVAGRPQPLLSHLPSVTDDLAVSLSQLKALRLAFGAASKWAHALKTADRERLLLLSNPADELLLSNPADPLTSLSSTSKDAGGYEQVEQPRWAQLICDVLATEVAEAKRACEGGEEELIT